MRVLFTPVGDTDPVRGYHDGGMLHILRHYAPVDRVFVFLTKEMEDKETESGCYTKGIQKVAPQCKIEFIRSGITEPHIYERLTVLQDVFQEKYEQYPNEEWLLNLSSGTPQIKSVMSLIGLDHPQVKAIQVFSPAEGSNNKSHPEKTPEMLEMLYHFNDDDDPSSSNRCNEPELSLLKKHSVKMQIISLVRNYEYEGALQLLRLNRELFDQISEKLLEHAVCRRNLMWRDANKIISSYKGSPLISKAGDFEEFFRVMELRQRKKQLYEFIVKITPICTKLVTDYAISLEQRKLFDLNACSEIRRDEDGDVRYVLKREKIGRYNNTLLEHLNHKYKRSGGFKDSDLSISNMECICGWIIDFGISSNERDIEIKKIFARLSIVSENIRNKVAHKIVMNLTENIIREWSKGKERSGIADAGLDSRDILNYLHRASDLIRNQKFQWDYGELNNSIIDSL
ncbi:MAG: type III-A CRISPR-associated CARF protein Csm6 [Dialister invisus]|uniref:type III-A CRISPR-associated CARF protein Csm6 n=1 Tax=Dialister invisus TaxID=218538 RepID=UPI003993C483